MAESTVTKGFVTLEGMVDLITEREDAEAAIRRLTGIRGIINKVVVRSEPLDPKQIREAIERALERRAEREVSGIEVSITDHCVVLDGRVHSMGEKNAVIGAVSHARGIQSVIDHLRVEPAA